MSSHYILSLIRLYTFLFVNINFYLVRKFRCAQFSVRNFLCAQVSSCASFVVRKFRIPDFQHSIDSSESPYNVILTYRKQIFIRMILSIKTCLFKLNDNLIGKFHRQMNFRLGSAILNTQKLMRRFFK